MLVIILDVGAVHIVIRPYATESWSTWFKKRFCKRLWKKERRMLEEMPVLEELRMSTQEPLFGVTSVPLRINFSNLVSVKLKDY